MQMFSDAFLKACSRVFHGTLSEISGGRALRKVIAIRQEFAISNYDRAGA